MLTGVGCGGVLKKEQRSSLARFCIMWGRVAMLVFSMTHGVGLLLSRNSFLPCMIAQFLKKHGSLTWLYQILTEVGAGIYCSVMVLRIGRQPLSTHSLSLFIPLCQGVRGMISWSGD